MKTTNHVPLAASGKRLGMLIVALLGMARSSGLLAGSPTPSIPRAVHRQSGRAGRVEFHGPLRLLKTNPRYFTDDSGRAIYLTGSHTWSDFQDEGNTDPPAPFDFSAYLDFLKAHHHNFVRLWRQELPRRLKKGKPRYAAPQPWKRVGPAPAYDGKPQFDLMTFNPAYFHRLRERVEAAGRRGIYVSVMLFEGYAMQFVSDAWQEHPFHPDNHLPNVSGFPAADSRGTDIFTLKYPAVTAVQEAYVRKVIDTVGDQDNVLYEISNETPPASTAWQYHMIRFIKQYEAKRGKSHPVGMTFQYRGGSNTTLFASPADWISPNADGGYKTQPPPADGRKVVLLDTDHLWGEGGNAGWVWKSFLQGYNPIFMDRIASITHVPVGDIAGAEAVRDAMGETLRIARRMNLRAMTPQPDLASTGYCLADPGREYLIYQPAPAPFTVHLTNGAYNVQWFDPATGRTTNAETVSGADEKRFTPPGGASAVLHLKRNDSASGR
jgi:Family of unknown function (DUF6298)/Putative collagen-binding domain of a collagenase